MAPDINHVSSMKEVDIVVESGPQHTMVSKLVPYLLRVLGKGLFFVFVFFTFDLLLPMQGHMDQQAPNLRKIR